MAPVIRCALVIAGLAYYSPYRGAIEIPDAVTELGQPAAAALGVPLSRAEMDLLRQLPRIADPLHSVSQGLEREIPRAAVPRTADPSSERSGSAHDATGRTPTPR